MHDEDDDGGDGGELNLAIDLPLSEMSLSEDFPTGGIFRPMRRMRMTINKYAARLACNRFYDDLVLGTVFSAQRRFLAYEPKIKEEGSVELQIAFRQLADRLAAVLKVHKVLRAWNDSQNPKSLEAADAPLQVLCKYLEARQTDQTHTS